MPDFPINNPLAIRDIIATLDYIKLQLERDMELLGAKSMIDEYCDLFNNTIRPKAKEYLAKCNTIKEAHKPFPESFLEEDIQKETSEETTEHKKTSNE